MTPPSHDRRLVGLLDEAFAVPLTLITGGSGWRQLSLLGLWAQQDHVLPVRRSGLDLTPVAFGRRLLETAALRHPAVELPGVPEMILLLARQEMERAAALYRGQFLEEHLSEDWSVAMRERCRLRFVDLSRHLARL